MIEIAVGSLICLIGAIVCIVVAGIIAFLARVAASQGGAIGCFVLVTAFLCILGVLLLCAGF